MEAIDKFGNKIYYTTYSRMLTYGLLLKKAGYVESYNKPNLFYKHTNEVTFFADMRGTDVVKIWENTEPLFYCKFEDNVPLWKQERLVNAEHLPCPVRSSFYSFENTIDKFYGLESNEANSLGFDYSGEYMLPDGYCIICGKDFQDDKYFCSDSCFEIAKKRDFARSINASVACEICGKKIPHYYKKIRNEMEDMLHIKLPALAILHHTDYANNITMMVCSFCYAKIHHSDDCAYAKYIPIDKKRKKNGKIT